MWILYFTVLTYVFFLYPRIIFQGHTKHCQNGKGFLKYEIGLGGKSPKDNILAQKMPLEPFLASF